MKICVKKYLKPILDYKMTSESKCLHLKQITIFRSYKHRLAEPLNYNTFTYAKNLILRNLQIISCFLNFN